MIELAIYKSFVKELFFCCVLYAMSSEVSTVTFCKSSNYKWNFNSWWVVFGLILSYSLLACLVFISPLPACLVVTLPVQRSTGWYNETGRSLELSVKFDVSIKGGCWSLDSSCVILTWCNNIVRLVASLSIACCLVMLRMLANERRTRICVSWDCVTPSVYSL